MAKDFEITCPHCSKQFSADDLLKDHLVEIDKRQKQKEKEIRAEEKRRAEEEASKKVKDNQKRMDSLLEANKLLKEKELNKDKEFKEKEKGLILKAKKEAEQELNKKVKDNEKKMDSLLEANKLLKQKELDNIKNFKEKEKEIADKAMKKAEIEASKKYKDSEKKLSSLQQANEILKEREAENSKKAKEREAQILSDANKKAQEFANAKIKQEKKAIEDEANRKAKLEANRSLKEKEIQLEKANKEKEIMEKKYSKDFDELKKKNEREMKEFQKKIKQEASERKGENQEQIIEDFLNNNFPLDKIIPIKKGARGADCIQQINENGRTNISRIYYESKDTKEFSESWVEKLLDDMAEKDINFGIIVTQTMPKTNDGKVEFRHNNRIAICPMDWEILWAQANAFRGMGVLFSKYEGKNTPNDLGKDELWDTFKTGKNYKLITQMNKQHLENIKILDSHEKSLNKLKLNSQNNRKVFLEFIANLKDVSDLYPDNFLDEE